MCRVEGLVMMFPQEEEMGELQRPSRQQRIYLRQHLKQLTQSFAAKGLKQEDMVVLSGNC